MDVSSDSAFSPIFEDFSQYGKLGNDGNQVISGVPIQVHTIKEMLADILYNIRITVCLQDHICFLIGEIIDVLKHHKWWYYYCLCDAPVCHVGNVFYCYLCRVECVDAIRRYRIKIIIFHSNGSNIFILQGDESTNDYTVPNSIISQLINKKIVFIVDPRPVGYELNTSLHIVRAICDDIDIVKFLEDSTHDNQQQNFDLDPFVPHFPFEFKSPVQFQSNASIQCSSSSSPPVGQASPISVLNWNCWINRCGPHDGVGRILIGNRHVPLRTHYLFLTTFLFVEPILIRSPLTQTSLLTLSLIPAKIESDQKRKKSPVVLVEQKEKHKEHLKKTKKMSSSSNRHGGDGGEVRASDILVKHHGSRRKASWKDPEGQVIKKTTRDSAVSQLKAFCDDIVSGKAKFEDIASRFSDCSSAKRVGDLGFTLFFSSVGVLAELFCMIDETLLEFQLNSSA
ncbi:Peptidyl-prolyl cis-trans isomerase [Arachis hypogaea]|uniref:peptidylprolyl isomerase n=1 Tax=Arachis hypogaea TaxID=3818 RepID=A0A6B9V8S9_ARAHY|nr:Peptidyl-prolyl cis-trans isomerase [Arachis hypogaea]